MQLRHFAALSAVLTLAGTVISAPRALAAPAPAVRDEVNPEVRALLDKSTEAYKAMKSYQHTAVYTLERGEQKQSTKFTLALERPNKFCFKMNDPLMVAAISDGKDFYNLKGDLKEYTKMPAPADYKGINIVDDVMFQPLATYLVALMLQGDALADKDIKATLEKATLSPDVTEGDKKWQVLHVPSGPAGVPMDFYFDAETHLLGKSVLKVEEQKVTLSETIEDVQIDKPIETSVFTFTPPDGAKLVKKFTDPREKEMREEAARLAKYEGKPALDFTLKDRAGKTVKLSALKGKTVIVDFWASWCGPCKMVMPTLQEIHKKFGTKGVIVLAVDTWDKPGDCARFLKENPQYTMRVLLDPAQDETPKSVATKLYGVDGIPTTLFIDKSGIVRKYIVGAHPREFYFGELKKLGVKTQVAQK